MASTSSFVFFLKHDPPNPPPGLVPLDAGRKGTSLPPAPAGDPALAGESRLAGSGDGPRAELGLCLLGDCESLLPDSFTSLGVQVRVRVRVEV